MRIKNQEAPLRTVPSSPLLMKSKYRNITTKYYKKQHIAWSRNAMDAHSKGDAVRISAGTLSILTADFSAYPYNMQI